MSKGTSRLLWSGVSGRLSPRTVVLGSDISLPERCVMLDVLFPQFFEQCFGVLEVSGVEALGEPAIDRRQQRLRCGLLALLLPQATETHGGAQFQSFRLLATGHVQGAL